jgi:hypothetical protein|tara:strand:- start:116 stop:607 length:492 start_codon:yes stop_codon:yes gene_type:complete
MNYLKISIAIFLALAASRFVPHPPNFTSLLALSFYVPAILGRKFLPALLISFIITDFIIGFHNVVFFTWGSVILIGIISKFFLKSIFSRLSGALMGAVIFFLFSNLGVWINGIYGYSLDGLILCYTMAIPFFSYSLISTLIFSLSLEMIMIAFKQINYFKNIN